MGAKRPLVIADAFNAARVDVLALPWEFAVFGDVKPEPDVPNLEIALAAARAAKPDLIVGFGGGSAMDLAKLVAVLCTGDQKLADVVGPDKVIGRTVALVQVPTTSGTGSEGGLRALVTDPLTRNKLAVQSRFMLADLAVVDPDLTISVPPQVTAATGVDALAHCVEAFTSRKAHPAIDLYAIEGIRLVGRYLARAVKDGADREARAGLSLASHTLAFNTPAVEEKTAIVLQALGAHATKDPAAVLEASYRFCASLGIEMRLSALGVPADDLAAMAQEAHAIRRLLDNNPRDLSRDDVLEMYRAAF
jgi:alcohol dehydrogenase class IV